MRPLLVLVPLALSACTGATIHMKGETADTAVPSSAVTLLSAWESPRDATPSADGSVVYVTDAIGLARLDEDGETRLVELRDAAGVVVSDDGATVYVADPGADEGGVIYAVDPETGDATPVTGSAGALPTALELAGDDLLFTGTDGARGAAVWRVPAAGGEAESLAAALPVTLTGVVAADDGAIYAAGGDTVYLITGGSATAVAGGATLGSPAGLALTADDTTLMLSSLSDSGTAQVLLIDRATGDKAVFDDGLSDNMGAGGLHRARQDPMVYAWADSSVAGGVYRVAF